MIEVTVDLPNIDDLVKRIQEAEGDAALAMAEAIHDDAVERAPHDTGELRRSGRTETRRDGTAIIFGSSKAPYAAAVHEDPSVRPTSGEKRFLRNAAMQGVKLLRVAAARLAKTFPK